MIRSPTLPAHELPADEWLAAPLGSPGAVLGAERPGTLVTIRLFRPRPAALRDQMPEVQTPEALLTLLPADAAVPPPASLPVPALVVDEIDPGTPAPRQALGPWQTSLVVQPQPKACGTSMGSGVTWPRRVPMTSTAGSA